MVCALCQSIERLSSSPRQDAPVPVSGTRGVCERCGRTIEGDTLERLTAKVEQLARFGLTGRPPLFRRRA